MLLIQKIFPTVSACKSEIRMLCPVKLQRRQLCQEVSDAKRKRTNAGECRQFFI